MSAEQRSVGCTCGTVQIALDTAPGSGALVTCYCRDCRAFPRILGRDDVLDDAGGVSMWQTVPDRFTVTAGLDKLVPMRLSPKGPLRWYATCCDTPIALTPGLSGVPFASFLGARITPAVEAPPVAKVFRKYATGKVAKPHGSLLALLSGFASRTLAARMRGAHKLNPLFDAEGRAIAKPHPPDPDAKARAYAT